MAGYADYWPSDESDMSDPDEVQSWTPTTTKPWHPKRTLSPMEQLQEFIDSWNANKYTWLASAESGYQQYVDAMKSYLGWDPVTKTFDKSGWPTFSPVSFNATTYNQAMGNVQSLIQQIQAGYQPADITQARNQAAALLGMTPEQFAAMEQAYRNATPESIQNRAQGMAFANDTYNQAFEAQLRSSQRAAEASMGKQLEAIFADRGGLGGFAKAQEYTLQISDQALRARTEFMVNRYNQAIEQVNADLDRQYQMISAGQGTAADLLNQRWQQLSTAYEGSLAMAQQIMSEFKTRSEINQADFNTLMEQFLAPVTAMKDILVSQIGVDEAAMKMMQEWYDFNMAPLLTALEASLM